MDGMDVMDGMDPECEALHLLRKAQPWFVSSLLSPLLLFFPPRPTFRIPYRVRVPTGGRR
jgi:hypothetical protein